MVLGFVQGEVRERREQKGAKSPPVRIRQSNFLLVNQAREEALRQILGVLNGGTAAPREPVERPPIRLAQRRQRRARGRGVVATGGLDDAPVCGLETAWGVIFRHV